MAHGASAPSIPPFDGDLNIYSLQMAYQLGLPRITVIKMDFDKN